MPITIGVKNPIETLIYFIYVCFNMKNIEESPLTEIPKQTSPTNGAIFKGILSFGIVFSGLIVFVFAGTTLQNTINGGSLWLSSLLVGVVFFIAIAILSKPNSLSFFNELKRQRHMYGLYLIGSIMWTFNLTSFIDTAFANPLITRKKFAITEKNISYGRYGYTKTYHIRCNNNGDHVLIQINKASWDKLKEYDTIELYLKKGFFGGEYVTLYQSPNQ